ncbi:hypothetical protein TWF694_009279 [Orbilia ellipsospora]|uniref:Uncharacterized protein n=1 Tax=Orbilia ellipsospora TaxID=2528407 RepID=A0AAV9XEG0_9PEZI
MTGGSVPEHQSNHRQTTSEVNDNVDPLNLHLGEDHTKFTFGLKAFFEHASIATPVIFEDAFWQDYNTGRCSPALAYAVACRGTPYTDIHDKWIFQQNLASKFREVFLTAQSQEETLRLDDIEALALMIDFQYNTQDTVGQIPPNLAGLFLKHDSLVLITLRAQRDMQDAVQLARSNDRRLLLFWHVYALDAFTCLDRRRMSYIPSQLTNSTVLQHAHKSYLDTILSLAIIARNCMEYLCSANTKTNGVRVSDIRLLYKQLKDWEREIPPSFSKCRTDDKLDPFKNASVPNSLRRAVLWLLQINCYLQIHSCVEEYGLQDGTSLQGEAAALKVESKTVQVFNELVEICQSIKSQREPFSLADLAPTMARNICAGGCRWICARGVNPLSIVKPLRDDQNKEREEGITRVRREEYRVAALLLRDVVASALSHEDTHDLVGRLDEALNNLL